MWLLLELRRPKSNTEAHLRQRKKHCGLIMLMVHSNKILDIEYVCANYVNLTCPKLIFVMIENIYFSSLKPREWPSRRTCDPTLPRKRLGQLSIYYWSGTCEYLISTGLEMH